MTKYIFVTGGVVSSVGKGITVGSIGTILKSRQISVSVQKLDPYLNVDPGTMSPYQHGEVFVTQDGAETDLDLGNYERFIDINLTAESNVTSGQIYSTVINKERHGEYLGGTIQVVPHVTSEIKERFKRLAQSSQAEVLIIEVGGTVGDIEGQPFLEAIRQMRNDVGRENVLYIHVTLLPYLAATKELKTKPTQHSVNELRRIGIQPDIIICRSDYPISEGIRDKISLFCDVEKQSQQPELSQWQELVSSLKEDHEPVTIALVGKYVELQDAYYSVREALHHAALHHNRDLNLLWVQSEDLEKDSSEHLLRSAQGIIVPGGFGIRGIEGMVKAASYARKHGIPYFGICLGMQVMVIDFARFALDSDKANSTEFDASTSYPVIALLPEQAEVKDKGGTMRLGNYPSKLVEGSLAAQAYGQNLVYERHRHRFEFNNHFRHQLEEAGMNYSGLSPDGRLVEICELTKHPWMVSCQFHPEFGSRPGRPHPLFRDFISMAKNTLREGAQPPLPLSSSL